MNLLQMSLSGALLISVIILLRSLLVERFPKRFFLLLWGICLVRLLVPFSISSSFSIYSLGTYLWSESESAQEYIAESPLADLLPVTLPSENIAPDATTATDSATTFVSDILGIPSGICSLIWLFGALFAALFFCVCYTACLRNYKTSLPVSTDFTEKWLREHPLGRKVNIRQSDLVSSPLTYGFFRPVILLPKTVDFHNTTQLDFIFLHEYVHIRRLDAMTKLLMIVTLCIHWFNPLVWVMYLFFNRDLELACDEAVVRLSGTGQRASYARTLVNMEQQRSVPTLLFNSFSKNTIEERIIAIMKPKKLTLWGGIVAFALVLCIGICFMTSAKAAEKPQSSDEITQETSGEADVEKAEAQLEKLQTELENIATELSEQAIQESTSSDETAAENATANQVPGTDSNEETSLIFLMSWPTESTTISSAYGYREHPLGGSFHDHIDIAGETGDDVYAALNGTITEIGFDGEHGRGNYIVLTTTVGVLIYGQLSEVLVSEGDEVTAGTVIGYLGATGMATGPHLSFGFYADDTAVNPMDYLAK